MTQTAVLDDINQLQGLYDGIAKQFNEIDYGDYLVKELDFIADLHKGFFNKSTGPDGSPWKKNAPRTIREKGHAVILRGKRGQKQRNIKATKRKPAVRFSREQGIGGFRLATSLTAKTSQTFGDAIREAIATDGGGVLSFGTDVEYSVYNQNRPHVGLTDTYLDKATNRVADFTLAKLAN